MTRLNATSFVNFFAYYRGETGQLRAAELLFMALQKQAPELLEEDADWIQAYRRKPPIRVSNPLLLDYMSQLDNGPQGWRQCQTSSIAMCLKYLGTRHPATHELINDDLKYKPYVDKHGDTTSAVAHQQALTELGVRHRFRTDMHKGDLIREIDKGYPVAIGLLHHGPVSKPAGGGHYVVAYGYTDSYLYVQDPYGELDLINGGWARQGVGTGKAQRYSWKNLLPRWDVDGGGWGWAFS